MLQTIKSAFQNWFGGLPTTVWIIAGVSFTNRAGSMIISFLTLYLTGPLHFDIATAGEIVLFFGVGGIAGSFVGGYLTDTFGYYKVQWLTLLIAGIVAAIIQYFASFYWLCAGIFMFSFISEAFRPANNVALMYYANDEIRTRAYSLLRISVNLAISFALGIGGLLIALGWRWLFWFDALTSIAAALVVLMYLPDNSKNLPQNVRERKNLSTIFKNSAYADVPFLLFTLYTFIGAVVFMQIIWTISYFFTRAYGWSEAQAGLMNALNCIFVLVVEMPLVFYLQKKFKPLQVVCMGIVCYGLAHSALFLPYAWTILPASIYILFISLGEILVMPFSSTWAAKHGEGARSGEYMGLYGIAYSFSHIGAPLLGTQIIARYGFDRLWMVLIILSILAFLGFYNLRNKE